MACGQARRREGDGGCGNAQAVGTRRTVRPAAASRSRIGRGHGERERPAGGRRPRQRAACRQRYPCGQRACGDGVAVRRGAAACGDGLAVRRAYRGIRQCGWCERQRRRADGQCVAARARIGTAAGRAVGHGHAETEAAARARRAGKRAACRQRQPCGQRACGHRIAVGCRAAARAQRLAVGGARLPCRQARRREGDSGCGNAQAVGTRRTVRSAAAHSGRIGRGHRERERPAGGRRPRQRAARRQRYPCGQRACGDGVAVRRGAAACGDGLAVRRAYRGIRQCGWCERQRRCANCQRVAARARIGAAAGRAVGRGDREAEAAARARRAGERAARRQRQPCGQRACGHGIAVRRGAAARAQRLAVGGARVACRQARRGNRHGRCGNAQAVGACRAVRPAAAHSGRIGRGHRERERPAGGRRPRQRAARRQRYPRG